MKRRRRNFTPQEKITILKRHLVDKVPISDLCDKHDLQPNLVYGWQQALFERGAQAFESKGREKRGIELREERIAALERKLAKKDEVLAELMEEHVALKKERGEI